MFGLFDIPAWFVSALGSAIQEVAFLFSSKAFKLLMQGREPTFATDVLVKRINLQMLEIGTMQLRLCATRRDDRGRDVGIRIDDTQRGPAWVTGARLFRAQSADGQGPKMCIGDSWEVVREGLSGRYDDNIKFLCPILRERAVLPDEVISTIDRITRHVANSPVLELPDEAWDDEPRLDFDCPKCGQIHRSTPFYVDRQRLNVNANSDTSR